MNPVELIHFLGVYYFDVTLRVELYFPILLFAYFHS